MLDTLTRKASGALLCLTLILAWQAGSLPAGATRPSWYEVNAVHREGLIAAAQQCLSRQEVELLKQALDKDDRFSPRGQGKVEPPLTPLKNRQFIKDLVNMVKAGLARGESAKVQKFFQVVNRQKSIRGYGQFFLQRGGYGGPMVIQLELRQTPQKEFQVEVWYRLVNPGSRDGKKQEGPRVTYGTGITMSH